ncbi:MAG TPA: hypothetical protein PLD60_07185, partial [Leptospiraceae bacterium]|nr:hypothetical protein [Leptospiraceae bacterium]
YPARIAGRYDQHDSSGMHLSAFPEKRRKLALSAEGTGAQAGQKLFPVCLIRNSQALAPFFSSV